MNEVEIKGTAADVEFELTLNDGEWTLLTTDNSDLHADSTQSIRKCTTIEAASVIALLIGLGEEDDVPKEVVEFLYNQAEKVQDVPQNLRLIP